MGFRDVELPVITLREALDQAVREARARFRYLPDPPGVEGDEWDTVAQVEAREAADCDGYTVWSNCRALALAGLLGVTPAQLYFVRGTVQTARREIGGHAWSEIRLPDGTRLWADATWGYGCQAPGWYSGRAPILAYPMVDELLGRPTMSLPA